jgi:hypothetical protein
MPSELALVRRLRGGPSEREADLAGDGERGTSLHDLPGDHLEELEEDLAHEGEHASGHHLHDLVRDHLEVEKDLPGGGASYGDLPGYLDTQTHAKER